MPGAEEEALMRTNYQPKKEFCPSKIKECAYL
jgi:hypothetical protein